MGIKNKIVSHKIVFATACVFIFLLPSCKSVFLAERKYNDGFFLSLNVPSQKSFQKFKKYTNSKHNLPVFIDDKQIASVGNAIPSVAPEKNTRNHANDIQNKTVKQNFENQARFKRSCRKFKSEQTTDNKNSFLNILPVEDPKFDGMGIAAMAIGIIGIEYFGSIVILPLSIFYMAIFSMIAGFSISAAFYLSVTAIFLFMLVFIGIVHSLISLLMSTQSMKRIREKPDEFKGYNFAKAGFITGSITAILTLIALTLAIAVLLLPAFFGL